MSDPKVGLTLERVEAALAKYGPNEIAVPVTPPPVYKLFVRYFIGFLPFFMEAAAIVSLAVQDYADCAILAGTLFINGVLRSLVEYNAKKDMNAFFNSMIESEVAVRRNEENKSISTSGLVLGDIILLVVGTVLPADVKWLHCGIDRRTSPSYLPMF
jgi:H+-transporting ATPase